jgi:hypothetical protein
VNFGHTAIEKQQTFVHPIIFDRILMVFWPWKSIFTLFYIIFSRKWYLGIYPVFKKQLVKMTFYFFSINSCMFLSRLFVSHC